MGTKKLLKQTTTEIHLKRIYINRARYDLQATKFCHASGLEAYTCFKITLIR